MSETKHTPGPWSWHGDELLSDKHFILACGRNGRPAKGDKDLIAASPKLLAALIRLRRQVDENRPLSGALKEADEAIAAATVATP